MDVDQRMRDTIDFEYNRDGQSRRPCVQQPNKLTG